MKMSSPEEGDFLRSVESEPDLVSFEIDDPIDVGVDEIEAARIGVLLGWRESGLDPTTVTLAFRERVVVQDGDQAIEVDAIYTHDTNMVIYGIDTIRKRYPTLSLAEVVLLLGAHEITHKAQRLRGEQPARAAVHAVTSDRYEVEAAFVSLCAYRAAFPDAVLDFSAGGYRYRSHPEPSTEIE